MANNQTTPATNRGIVEAVALALVFSTEKSSPLVPVDFRSKGGAVTFASIRAGLRVTEPNLSGNALSERVALEKNKADSTVLAGVLQLHREGFHFQRFNGRELKNGTRTVSVGMSNARDTKAAPAKKITDLTAVELRELLALREKADKAVVTHDV